MMSNTLLPPDLAALARVVAACVNERNAEMAYYWRPSLLDPATDLFDEMQRCRITRSELVDDLDDALRAWARAPHPVAEGPVVEGEQESDASSSDPLTIAYG